MEPKVTELTIKSDQLEAVKSEIQTALESQRKMVQNSLKRTLSNLETFEQKFGFTTSILFQKEAQGQLNDDNLEFIEWLGEAHILKRLQTELDLLDGIQICS